MTQPQAVIPSLLSGQALSAAKDLWCAFVQPPCLKWPCGPMGNHQVFTYLYSDELQRAW